MEPAVRVQRLEVEAGSGTVALALQPRISELNRRRLVPVIDRVLREMAEPGRQVRIERLSVDLGEVSLGALETELPRRLERALRRAVAAALRGEDPAAAVRARSEGGARAELLEHHLVRGTLPFWAPRATSLASLVDEMAASEPRRLGDVVRRLGARPGVTERLVRQLAEPGLVRLVRALEPAHAALVLAYVLDLRRVHRRAPLLSLSERRFGRELWTLVHTYLVRDPGSQFNRRSFVRSLLVGMARGHGMDYAALLATLGRALERTRRRRAARSSLPAVVGELLREAGLGAADAPPAPPPPPARAAPRARLRSRTLARYDAADAAGYLLRHGVLPWSAALAASPPTEAGVLATLVDLPLPLLAAALGAPGAERRAALAALARRLPDDDLARLLARVLPAAAGAGPLGASIAAFAAAAADRPAFLARVLGAALEGGPLDLEALAAEAGGIDPPRSGELAAWPAHLLASVLTGALRAGAARAREHPTPAALLGALVGAHPADARACLRALAERPELAAAVARTAAPPLHDRVLELLHPGAADTARALHAALAALPSPHRRASGRALGEVVLVEILRLPEGEVPGEAFFARVLARAFGARIPEAVGARLLAAAEAWARPGALPPAHAEAFRAAVAAALAAPGAPPEPAAEPAPPAAGGAAMRRARRAAVFAFLLGRPAGEGAPGPDALRHLLERMVEDSPAELAAFLRRHAGDRRARERWARTLPEGTLARLAALLAPRRHDRLLAAAEALHGAWVEAAPPGEEKVRGRAAFWSFLLEFGARTAAADRRLDRLVHGYFADRAARCLALSPRPELPAVGARLLDAAVRAAAAGGDARLRASLHRQRARLLALWGAPEAPAVAAAPPPPEPRRSRPAPPRARHGDDPAEDEGEPVYVANAGLVIVAPFLPRLFERLGVLAADAPPRLRDADALSRAVHLLQYLVDGRTDTPEPALALNKLLAGAALDAPVDASIVPTDEELATCDGLLRSIIASWDAIGGTSVAGLRETFLQREGRLVRSEAGWRLTVQRRTLDVLLDRLPWGFSVVLHPWMSAPLHVSW